MSLSMLGVSSYTVTNTGDEWIDYDVTNGDGMINLPDPATFGYTDTNGDWRGYSVVVCRVSGGSHALTVHSANLGSALGGAGTAVLINGATSLSITTQWQAWEFYSTGTTWRVVKGA